jgi:uncharacterized DUF497 family protein
MPLIFEWDAKKARSNRRKHGVSFDEACTVFDDPLAAIFADEDHSTVEPREIIICHSILKRLVLVCFTERPGHRVRVFSARRATPREQKNHEDHT